MTEIPTLDELFDAMDGKDPSDPIHVAMSALLEPNRKRYLCVATLAHFGIADVGALATAADELHAAMAEVHRVARAIDQRIADTVFLPAAPDAVVSAYTIGDVAVAISYAAFVSAAERDAGKDLGGEAQLRRLYRAYDELRAYLLAGQLRLPDRRLADDL